MDTDVSLASACTDVTKCEYTCASGYVLQNGACTAAPANTTPLTNLSCTDTDGGFTPFVGDNVSVAWNNGTTSLYRDYCTGTASLWEQVCDGTQGGGYNNSYVGCQSLTLANGSQSKVCTNNRCQ